MPLSQEHPADHAENQLPTLRKNTAEPAEKTLNTNTSYTRIRAEGGRVTWDAPAWTSGPARKPAPASGPHAGRQTADGRVWGYRTIHRELRLDAASPVRRHAGVTRRIMRREDLPSRGLRRRKLWSPSRGGDPAVPGPPTTRGPPWTASRAGRVPPDDRRRRDDCLLDVVAWSRRGLGERDARQGRRDAPGDGRDHLFGTRWPPSVVRIESASAREHILTFPMRRIGLPRKETPLKRVLREEEGRVQALPERTESILRDVPEMASGVSGPNAMRPAQGSREWENLLQYQRRPDPWPGHPK